MGTLQVSGNIKASGTISSGNDSLVMSTSGSLATYLTTTGGWARGWSYNVNDTSMGGFGFYGSGSTKINSFYVGTYSSPWMSVTPAGTVTATTFSGSLSGNAATATTLKTARTLTIGATGKTFNGSANVSWTPFEMRLTRAQYNIGTNMNQIADHGCELGMANLSGTDTTINPGGGTSWHHYINMTWSDCADNNGSTTNEWCTQIATKAGTTDLWVRSRSGGSITDGTAWVADWTRILTGSNYTSVLDGRYVNVSGDTMTGNLTVPSVYTSNWFRSTGKTGWYSESYGGGWYMTDSSYIRSYNQKAIYLGNSVYIGTSAGAGTGIALYSSSAPDTYGIHMSYTSTYGTHGAVTGDWANYFCFSGSTNRGWIFRQAGSNVASVSGSGVIYANSYIYTNSYLQANTHLYLTSTTSKIYMRYNSTWYPVIENHANGNVTFDACGGFFYPAYSNRSLGIILSANTYGSSLPTTNLQTGRIFYKT